MRQKNLLLKKHKGFTLVEVLVTVAILAFGIVTIYEALFISMDTFGFYTNYLDTQDWIDEKIAQVQDELTDAKVLEEGALSGRIVRKQKTYHWRVMISPVDEVNRLYRIRVNLSWKQGRKTVNVSRETFLIPPQLVEYREENFV